MTQSSAAFSTWSEAEMAINRLAAEDPSLTQNTIENAQLLAGFAAGRYRAPNWIGSGYLPTVRISWSSPDVSIEIEVCDDHYEFYRFFDGATDIQHVDIIQGSFPDTLQMILDTVIAQAPMAKGDKA